MGSLGKKLTVLVDGLLEGQAGLVGSLKPGQQKSNS
jgi:hypothetical protein